MTGKIPRKLPGEVRIRLNFVVDHATNQRFRKQAKIRAASLSDTFRHALELLEKEHAAAREVIMGTVSGVRCDGDHAGPPCEDRECWHK